VRRGAPRFGEHTREILQSLGYAAADVERLLHAGAVAADAAAPVAAAGR
jgi:crotonobetainyl-CoA:carnitine CoA-transferase CaiB-like acyl-CoA transferase